MSLNRIIPIFVGLMLSCFAGSAQPKSNLAELPGAFLIGDFQAQYETLIERNSSRLLTVCDNSMDVAYSHWMTMLNAMEDYSDKVDFDLKGIKIWINVFWKKDGSINHIVYYPKPNCRNMEFEDLTAFFNDFTRQYVIPLEFMSGFSHYGSASFPTFNRSLLVEDK